MSHDIRRFSTASQMVDACGRQILDWLGEAIAVRGVATLAISGGSSPKPMFEEFARTRFPWDKVQLYLVDERCVPITDSQSNFKFASDAWLNAASYPAANIHRVHTELDPPAAAERYAQEIRSSFGLKPEEIPVFDVIHRGMGPDAHTASLFPGEPLIRDRSGIAAAVWVEKFKQWRVTLLPAVLLAARHTAILVAGADKAEALAEVLNGPADPIRYPAQITPDAVWFVDAAAAARVP